jgi:UDP-MurNAc hydroxylase
MSENRVTFLGQAGLFLEYGGVKILCDPWLSKTGAFLASWHQFPRNDFLDPVQFRSATHLYISHKHQDHFDSEFLKSMPKSVQVLIAAHPSGYLYAKLRDLGFTDVRVMRDWEKRTLSSSVGATMLMNSDDGKYVEDSAMLFELDGFKILNRNDCRLSEEYCRKLAPVDLLFTQFSGAHWYPVMWEYGLQERQQKVDLFKKNLKEKFAERVSWLEPVLTVPSAGPACFLDRELYGFNFNSIFPDAYEFGFGEGVRVLTPGQALTIPALRTEGDFDSQAYLEKEKYLREYQKERMPIIENYLASLPSEVSFQDFKSYLYKLAEYDLARKVNILACFNISGRKIYVDFEKGIISDSTSKEPNFEIRLEERFLKQILSGDLLWEDFLLSMRFSSRKNTANYSWPLFALLRFGYSKPLMRIVEDGVRSTETIRVGDYEIQRYCPHSGQDLTEATVNGTVITCPRHLWSFDLETGECVSGGDLCLRTKKLVSNPARN